MVDYRHTTSACVYTLSLNSLSQHKCWIQTFVTCLPRNCLSSFNISSFPSRQERRRYERKTKTSNTAGSEQIDLTLRVTDYFESARSYHHHRPLSMQASAGLWAKVGSRCCWSIPPPFSCSQLTVLLASRSWWPYFPAAPSGVRAASVGRSSKIVCHPYLHTFALLTSMLCSLTPSSLHM